jgi:hypothetical protein
LAEFALNIFQLERQPSIGDCLHGDLDYHSQERRTPFAEWVVLLDLPIDCLERLRIQFYRHHVQQFEVLGWELRAATDCWLLGW